MEFTANWFADWAEPYWGGLFEQLGYSSQRPCQVLEIGCFEGQASVWLLQNLLGHADSKLTCIDTFGGSREHDNYEGEQVRARFLRNVKETGRTDQVRLLEGSSFDRLIQLNQEGDRFDLVYVDGSHLAKDVLDDLVLSYPLVVEGGFVLCDDYLWNYKIDGNPNLAPKIAIDSFTTIHCREIVNVVGYPAYQHVFRKDSTSESRILVLDFKRPGA